MVIAALYARVSTVRQAENELSIPDQIQQMRDWCQANEHTIANEYVEPGASARDDKRPVFQQMIADALLSPSPFGIVVVHSLSRFFRDSIELGLYERKLKRAGIKLISITQITADDAAGEMARKMFSLFDEYQSKENAKHTLRAMIENARQGFFNGSRPPFGYQVVATDITGNRGRKKKKLAVELSEAEIVRHIYNLYLDGHNGLPLGMKAIATLLNEQSYTMRGNPWRVQKVNEILSDTTYIGEYVFNRYSYRDKRKKAKEDHIISPVEPIIDRETFERVAHKRDRHSPRNTPPRVHSSPVFLSGLLKCQCGASMTLMTGKSGQYRYYKCEHQKHHSRHACTMPNIPMDKLDRQVRERLSERGFTPKRVRNMLVSLKKQVNAQDQGTKSRLAELNGSLKKSETALNRLYEGIETGVLDLGKTLTARIQKLKAKQDEINIQITALKRQQDLPIKAITPKHIDAFCYALKRQFNNPASNFGKGYLRVLVDEIRVKNNKAEIRGSYGALAQVMSNLKPETHSMSVPTFMQEWRALEDSNL